MNLKKIMKQLKKGMNALCVFASIGGMIKLKQQNLKKILKRLKILKLLKYQKNQNHHNLTRNKQKKNSKSIY